MQLETITEKKYSAFDILPGNSFAEKATSLMLERSFHSNSNITAVFDSFRNAVNSFAPNDARVTVFGGGTGLSTIIGGDSKKNNWRDTPFTGLKEIFSQLHTIVCITDDGGSTGELLKDIPLIALGDLRHVLLSAVRKNMLIKRYGIDTIQAHKAAQVLHQLFNYRFITFPESRQQLLHDANVDVYSLPTQLAHYLNELTANLFNDPRLVPALSRPQCLGNLLLASAIYKHLDPVLSQIDLIASHQIVRTATIKGLKEISQYIGAQNDSVWPCTTTPSQLQFLYSNGVLVSSEEKSQRARRGYPVDRVFSEFSRRPFLHPEIVGLIESSDIIVFAPGSLYSSILPILQIPGIAGAVRKNKDALKILVSNIWVQKGETDTARHTPERKFYVSDLIQAYNRNIPGGIEGLFSHVLCLNMEDIPGSVLQKYALEDKEPIFLDRMQVEKIGLRCISARIFSEELVHRKGVIQHDPDALALVVKTLFILKKKKLLEKSGDITIQSDPVAHYSQDHKEKPVACLRYQKICALFNYISTEIITAQSSAPQKMDEGQRRWLIDRLVEFVWIHPDILFEHLEFFRGVTLVDPECWNRSQQWDNVFSFYDPVDCKIKIRQDQAEMINRFEVVFFIALGQSLLGNYFFSKEMVDIHNCDEFVGRMYRLTLREPQHINSFFSLQELDEYLGLCKMKSATGNPLIYSRVVNIDEGFTPPGLFFGLFYAWYLDNRFAPNIDYKMSIMKHDLNDLIPEQKRIRKVREKTVKFFREKVFRQSI